MDLVPTIQRINVNMNVPGGAGGGLGRYVPRGAGRLLGPLGLATEGITTAINLKSSLDKGEGFAALPGLFSKFQDYLSKDKNKKEENIKSPASVEKQSLTIPRLGENIDPASPSLPKRNIQPGYGGGFPPPRARSIDVEGENNGSRDVADEIKPSRAGTDTSTGQREIGPRLDINATKEFKDLFNAGVANKDKIKQMYAGNENLQKWAAANPALAQREFNKMKKRGLLEEATGSKLDPTTGFADINDPSIITVPGQEGTMSIAEFVKKSDQPIFSTQQEEGPVNAQDFLMKRVGNLMDKSAKDVAIEMDPNDYFKSGYNLGGLFSNQ